MAEERSGIITVANAAFCRMFGLGEPDDVPAHHALSDREYQVLRMIGAGSAELIHYAVVNKLVP